MTRESFLNNTKEIDERFEKLKSIYPEAFSDGKINKDVVKDIFGLSDLPEDQDKTPGYYGLYWPGKRAAKQLARKEAEGTLEPVIGDGVNEDTTHNIYIEGDNLEVLRILKQSYKGRIKMIYIDPPYNTGNDFIYPDNYKMPVEEYLRITGQTDESGKALSSNLKSNGAFHTNWLNMMLPRLMLARELLTEDGVIFISIDDNEQSNLKLLCDDVFGEENFINNIIWQKKYSPQNDARWLSDNHDFIIAYAKNKEIWIPRLLPRTEEMNERYKNPDNDPKGPWKLITLHAKSGNNSNFSYTFKNGVTWTPPSGTFPRFSVETMKKFDEEGKIWFGSDGKSIPSVKNYLSEVKQGVTPLTLWTYDEVGHNQTAREDVKKCFDGVNPFDTPKPVSLIKRVAYVSNANDEDIVLDFFSGSATTAHSTMQLNADDNGKRKFIMVQLPHPCEENSEAAKAGYKNICEIGKERIRRAGSKILEEAKTSKDMFSEDNQLDVGFKVYRLNKSNFEKYTPVEGQNEEATNSLFEELENNLVPLVNGWKPENVLTEIILRQGFALDCTRKKLESFTKNTVYKITDSPDTVSKKIKLYVCLDPVIEQETITSLSLGDDEKFICLDSAIDDSTYARLSDKGRIETI